MFSNSMMMSSKVAASGTPPPPAQSTYHRWYNLTDMANLYQDAAKTTAVTATGQFIGSAKNLAISGSTRDLISTNGTAGYPLFEAAQVNGLPVATFDGVDDIMKEATKPVLNDPIDIWIVFNYTDRSGDYIFEFFWPRFIQWGGTQFGIYAGRWALVAQPAPGWHAMRLVCNSASSSVTFDNGTPVNIDIGTKMTQQNMAIGARNSTASFSQIKVAEFIQTPTLSSADAITMWAYIHGTYGI